MLSATAETRLSDSEIKQVNAQLDRILGSSFFQGSQRCTRFLQYSVENVLSGCSPKELKERIIGVEVFHRDSDYDTAQDSTVRVTANEVRKRLAQYYSKAVSDDPLIELPTGSYAVTFRWRAKMTETGFGTMAHDSASGALALPALAPARAEPLAAKQQRRHAGILLACLTLLVAVAAIAYAAVHHRRFDPTIQVWAPLLNSKNAITICVAEPMVYRPSSGRDQPSRPGEPMIALPDAVVGVGDAYALADITGFLESRDKSWHLLPSGNTSFRDLTTGPVILIGSFSNPWANRLLGSLRYVFVEGVPNRLIDRTRPQKGWTIQVTPQWTALEDYAVISKFKSRDTGETIISLGGATNFGTEAAGEFLTNSEMLAAGMRDGQKDWRSKNFQLVLHVNVQGTAPEQPTVVASYFW